MATARRIVSISALGLCGALFAGAAAADGQLRVVNNGGAVADASRAAWYAPFSEKTGVEIIEDNWNQEYARLRTQIETGNLVWDAVEITFNHMALGCEEGYLERIDWSQHLDPKDFEAAGGVTDCAVPIMSVVGGLVYDADVITGEPPQTWADFWNVEKWPGKRGLIFRPTALEIALLADGVPPDEVIEVLAAEGGVDRAFAKLDELKPHIHWWKSGAESTQILAAKEVVMAYAWNGRVAVANERDKLNLKFAFDGGFVLGNQYLAIMAGSPNKDLAVEFIVYASSPEPLAAFAGQMNYGPPNEKSLAFVDDKLKAVLPSEHMDKAYVQAPGPYLEFWLANQDALTQRLATWFVQ